MRLVGATDKFIRKPFIRNNVISGVLAGILANGAIWVFLHYFKSEVAEVRGFVNIQELMIVFGVVIFLGVIISVIATHYAVNRYLKMTTNKLYRV